MGHFNNKTQDNFKADFGFMAPHRTKSECKNPIFADKHLHRIAIMKDEHFGSKGDRDEGGLPGWTSKFICTGCSKRYTIDKNKSFFHPDKKKAIPAPPKAPPGRKIKEGKVPPIPPKRKCKCTKSDSWHNEINQGKICGECGGVITYKKS